MILKFIKDKRHPIVYRYSQIQGEIPLFNELIEHWEFEKGSREHSLFILKHSSINIDERFKFIKRHPTVVGAIVLGNES